MLSSESGYPLQWFVDRHSIDDYLKCGICGNVLRDPRATNCGHVFCLSCLLGWIDAYGICPQRCGEVEADQMKRALHIEKRISGLLTLCKYQHYGCTVQVPLADKALHESTCPYRQRPKLTKALSNQFQLGRSTVESKKNKEQTSQPPYQVHHKRTRSSGSGLGQNAATATTQTKSGATTKRSPSLCTNRTCQIQHQQQRIPTGMNHQAAAMQGTTHSFRLKRTRAREPLGLVLVCGEKTPEGKPLSFYVKKVNPDTLGWKAGIEAGDRIVQVDYYDLARIDPQEAVARIKDKPVVALTVLRGFPKPAHLNRSKSDQEAQHIYDEIMYADALSQQDENLPPVISAGVSALNARKHRFPMLEDPPNRSSKAAHKRPVSPAGNTFFRTSSGPPAPKHQSHNRSNQSHRSNHHHHHHHQHPHQTRHLPGGESKGSKDSGLSSGSSGTGGRHHHALQHDIVVGQPQHVVGDMRAFERSIYEGRSNFRTEQDIARKYHFEEGSSGRRASDSGSSAAAQLVARKNCRIEGEYEVEEIYLEKNGTSQLGITLGYDTQSAKGHLYVCEVLPTGLAAQDGRLQCGDIIRRVNGFEVYDPEEAVLLFLEQDQDITLTVARKIKAPPSHQRLHTSPPRDFSFSQPEGEHSYAVLEGRASIFEQQRHMRRIDSCGSLDSHSHRYFSENQRHHLPPLQVDLPPNTAQFQPITAVRVNIDDEEDTGYEVLNRQRSGSSGSHMSRGSRERRGERRKSQSPSRSDTSPRNPSPLCMESTTSSSAGNYPSQQQLSAPPPAVTSSPDYIIQQDHSSALTASDCQFRPISVNETRTRPRTSSGGERFMSKPPSSSNIARPSSTTPGGRHRINSRGSGGEPCEPKIMSPLSPTRKVPQSFKMIAGDIHKLPSRCDPALPQAQMELVFSRSESLV